jgi:hypothetical protein
MVAGSPRARHADRAPIHRLSAFPAHPLLASAQLALYKFATLLLCCSSLPPPSIVIPILPPQTWVAHNRRTAWWGWPCRRIWHMICATHGGEVTLMLVSGSPVAETWISIALRTQFSWFNLAQFCLGNKLCTCGEGFVLAAGGVIGGDACMCTIFPTNMQVCVFDFLLFFPFPTSILQKVSINNLDFLESSVLWSIFVVCLFLHWSS